MQSRPLLAGLTFVVLLVHSGLASSQASKRATVYEKEQDKRFYVAPMISYGFFGETESSQGADLSLDDGEGVSLAVGKPLTNWANLELQAFYFDGIERTANSRSEADIHGYGASVLLFPMRERLPIFGILGYSYGKYKFDPGGGDPYADYYDAGVGYTHELNDFGIALRAEYRYRQTELRGGNDFESEYDEDHILSLGVQVPLGAKPAVLPPPKPETPEPQPGRRPQPEPAAPLDSDNDGVPNERDQCPGSIATEVDETGCEVEAEPLTLTGGTFESNSAALTTEAESRLDELAQTLASRPELRIVIEGHTDSQGAESYNLALSRERADAVKNYLINQGVAASRMATQGYGEARPIAPNDNPAGRAQNRRVEIHTAD